VDQQRRRRRTPIINAARVIATTPTDQLGEQVGRCEGPAGERLLATVMTATTSSPSQQQQPAKK